MPAPSKAVMEARHRRHATYQSAVESLLAFAESRRPTRPSNKRELEALIDAVGEVKELLKMAEEFVEAANARVDELAVAQFGRPLAEIRRGDDVVLLGDSYELRLVASCTSRVSPKLVDAKIGELLGRLGVTDEERVAATLAAVREEGRSLSHRYKKF